MRLKTLLLASAAGMVPAGAFADDLVLAIAPIDYVHVCDGHGSGYMYLPGTETCLSIGGYLQFDMWLWNSDQVQDYFDVAKYLSGATTNPSNPLSDVTGVVAGYLYDTDAYAAPWTYSEEIKLIFDAKTTTDLGLVETYARLVIESEVDFTNTNHPAALARTVSLDRAFAAIGPLFVGSYDSIFALQNAGYSLDGALNADPIVDQFQLNHTWGPWKVAFALEDPRDWFYSAANATGDYPNLAFALTGTWKNAFVQAALGVTDRTSGTGWGAQVSGTFGSGTKPQLQFNLAYAENAPAYVGGLNCSGVCGNEGAWWSGMLSGQVNLTKTLSLNTTGSYVGGPGSSSWEAAVGAGWAPTTTALLSVEALYADLYGVDSFGLHTQLKTSFGNDD
jgi:hypothetical protein